MPNYWTCLINYQTKPQDACDGTLLLQAATAANMAFPQLREEHGTHIPQVREAHSPYSPKLLMDS